MKKIVRIEGDMIKVKKKGKILRREHEGRVLWCSKIFKNRSGKPGKVSENDSRKKVATLD